MPFRKKDNDKKNKKDKKISPPPVRQNPLHGKDLKDVAEKLQWSDELIAPTAPPDADKLPTAAGNTWQPKSRPYMLPVSWLRVESQQQHASEQQAVDRNSSSSYLHSKAQYGQFQQHSGSRTSDNGSSSSSNENSRVYVNANQAEQQDIVPHGYVNVNQAKQQQQPQKQQEVVQYENAPSRQTKPK